MYKREERLWPDGCGLFPSHSCVKREDSKSNKQYKSTLNQSKNEKG